MDNRVIHASSNANFSAYTYTQVYCGGSTPTNVTINGVVVNIAPGNPIDIMLYSISGAANVYVIGHKKIKVPKII